MRSSLDVYERRAGRVLKQFRTTQRYVAKQPEEEQLLRKRIIEIAHEYGRYGCRRVRALLRMEGWMSTPRECNGAGGSRG